MRILAMRTFVIAIGAALLAVAFAGDANAERTWFVQTADNKIVGFTDSGGHVPVGTVAVLESVIREADPPGADGDILSQGTWIVTGGVGVYTPPLVSSCRLIRARLSAPR